MSKLIDISPPISPALCVWPGDTPPSREVLLDMKSGANITLSTLRATVHLGAHVDAPSHYGTHAPAIHERPVETYIGPCQVVRVDIARGMRIAPEHITSEITEPRVLLCTGTFPDPTRWTTDFAAIAPGLVDWLADLGVLLVGIDVPSVDLFESKDLPAHKRFLARDVAILEGIVLNHVEPGRYELIAPPLKLIDFDASPVRALLRRI